MYKNILLAFILICYLLGSFFLYRKYSANKSIYNIIYSNKYKYYVLFAMFLLGIGLILYEIQSDNIFAFE